MCENKTNCSCKCKKPSIKEGYFGFRNQDDEIKFKKDVEEAYHQLYVLRVIYFPEGPFKNILKEGLIQLVKDGYLTIDFDEEGRFFAQDSLSEDIDYSTFEIYFQGSENSHLDSETRTFKAMQESKKTKNKMKLQPNSLIEKTLKKLSEKYKKDFSKLTESVNKISKKEDEKILEYGCKLYNVYERKGMDSKLKEQAEAITSFLNTFLKEQKEAINKMKIKEATEITKSVSMDITDNDNQIESLLKYLRNGLETGKSLQVNVDSGDDQKSFNIISGNRITSIGFDETIDTLEESKKSLEKSLLFEKVDLKVTSNTKKELLKQTRTALDALLSIYDQLEKNNLDNSTFTNLVDEAFSNTNEILTILVVQDSIEKK